MSREHRSIFPAVAISLVSALLVLGCGAGDRADDATIVRDSAGVQIVENNAADIADSCAVAPEPRVDIGRVEGPDEYELYSVSAAVTLSDGRIALVNRGTDEIRVYDQEGRFLHAFGREGGGPGEFRSVFRLWVLPGDTLLVGDYRPWRYSAFTAEGDFVRSFEPTPAYLNPPPVAGILSDGSFVLGEDCCRASGPGFHERQFHVVHHAPDGELIDTVGVYPYGRWGRSVPDINFVLRPLFEPLTAIGIGGERIVIGRAEDREFEVRHAEGTLEQLVRWTGEDRTVRSADVEAYRRRWRERGREMPSRARRLVNARITEDRPVNDRFPAYSSIRVARDRYIWVKDYPRPADPEESRWFVFDGSGRFTCHVPLPEGLEVFEIGRDYVLGKEQDELDVEYVRIYEVSRPS